MEIHSPSGTGYGLELIEMDFGIGIKLKIGIKGE